MASTTAQKLNSANSTWMNLPAIKSKRTATISRQDVVCLINYLQHAYITLIPSLSSCVFFLCRRQTSQIHPMSPVFCTSFEFAVIFQIIPFFNVVNPDHFMPAIDCAYQYQQSVVATTSLLNHFQSLVFW